MLVGDFFGAGLYISRYLILRVRRSHIVEDSLRVSAMVPGRLSFSYMIGSNVPFQQGSIRDWLVVLPSALPV